MKVDSKEYNEKKRRYEKLEGWTNELGRWVKVQRVRKRLTKDSKSHGLLPLTTEQVAMLDRLEFEWNPRHRSIDPNLAWIDEREE